MVYSRRFYSVLRQGMRNIRKGRRKGRGYYANKRRFYKKRRGRGRGRRSKNNGTLVARGSIVPKYTVTKLRFSTFFALDPGVGVVASHVFNIANINDPDTTGAGTNARGTNEFYGLWTNAMVIGSKITIRMTNTDAAAQVTCGLYSSEANQSPGTTTKDFMENGASFRTLAGTEDGSPNIGTFTTKYTPRRQLRVTHPFDEEADLGALDGVNPLRGWHVRVWAGACNPTRELSFTECCCFIQFIVMFYAPKTFVSS